MGAAPHECVGRDRPPAVAGQSSDHEPQRSPADIARHVGLFALGCLLAVTMLAAAVADRLSSVLNEPDLLVATLTSPTVIDFAYDDVLPAALADQLDDAVIEVDGGEDVPLPEHAPAVARELIEQLWPRDDARAQLDTAVRTWAPQLANGQLTSDVALGPTAAGWSGFATATSTAFGALGIYDVVIEQVVAPRLRVQANDALGPDFGVSLSESDSRIAARRLLPPVWTREQVAALAGAAAPYLSGAADEFRAVVPLRSRVPPALLILHEEITEERALLQLVREQILSPLIEARIRQAGRLPLGIELSAEEVEEALLTSIPAGWFAGETSLLAQVLAEYLVGERDDITLKIPLAERNAAFARRLADVVHTKLGLRLADLPQCRRRQLYAAGRSLRAGALPSCAPGSVSLLKGFLTPLIEAEFERIVNAMPTALSLEHGDVARHVGEESVASLVELRRRIHDGLVWTERDLVGLFEEREAGPALELVRRGTVTPQDLMGLVPRGDPQMEKALRVGKGALRRPWLFDLLALALAVALAGLTAGSRTRRLQFTAYVVSVSAAVVVVTLVCLDVPATAVLAEGLAFDPQSWPRLSDVLASGPVPVVVSDLSRELRYSAALNVAPWMLLGPVVYVGRRIVRSRAAAQTSKDP